MDLFEIVNGRVFPSVHALRLEPFKGIWEQDRSPMHEEALKVFDYIEFMCSPKKSNIYHGYTDPDIRATKVKERVFKDPNYPTTTDMMLGCMEYIEILKQESVSYDSYQAGMETAFKLKKWLTDFDLNEKTPNGALLLKPRDVNAALKEVANNIKSLEEARKQVVFELNESSRKRAGREPGYFEK